MGMRANLNYRLAALSLGLLSMTLLMSPAQAQRFGSGRGGGFASRGHAMGGHSVRGQRGRRGYPGYWYGPNYYPDYDSYSDSGDQIADEGPARYVVQGATPASPAVATKPSESVVMELRGDHWVRLTSYGVMEVAGQASAPQSERAGNTAASVRTEAPAALPPAVLVFRDGRQEDIAKYTIVGSTIFLKADYWANGSWTRKVQISELDVAATLKANQERGAKFSLPSRPGEVMMRP